MPNKANNTKCQSADHICAVRNRGIPRPKCQCTLAQPTTKHKDYLHVYRDAVSVLVSVYEACVACGRCGDCTDSDVELVEIYN